MNEKMQTNVLSNIIFSLLSHCVILKSLVITFLLGLNELLEMQNACQISRQPDWQIDNCTFIIYQANHGYTYPNPGAQKGAQDKDFRIV